MPIVGIEAVDREIWGFDGILLRILNFFGLGVQMFLPSLCSWVPSSNFLSLCTPSSEFESERKGKRKGKGRESGPWRFED